MNRIGWCSQTWNPVWGCRNRRCPYCYARIFAKRFYRPTAKMEYKGYICSPSGEDGDPYDVMRWIDDLGERLRHFIPTFLEAKFKRRFPKKPQRIFVGSMSEINHWEERWMERVLEKIKEYPQHIFMFLTQYPEVYAKYLFSPNCWYGVTIPRNEPIERIGCVPTKKGIKFLSIEPILEKIDIEHIDDFEPDWIIVGAESGNRKGKIIPKKEWIEVIIDFCNRCNRPIYIKDNLTKYFPEFEGMKEFPKLKK